MPATKDMSKAVGASQVQGRLWCGMAGMIDIDAGVGIGRLEGRKNGGSARLMQFGGSD